MIQKIIVFAGVGMEIGLLIFGAYKLGEFLDQSYHSQGLIFVGLAFLLLIGWLVQVIWLIKKYQKDDESSGNPS